MIYVSKIIQALVQPINIFIFLVFIALIKGKKLLIWVALVFLYVLSIPFFSDNFFSWVENSGSRKEFNELTHADAIVVLSGMTISIKTSHEIIREWTDPDRFYGGVELWKIKKAPMLIFTRGRMQWSKGPFECDFLTQKAIEMGVDSSKIMLTGVSETTEDESRKVRECLVGKSRKIILVTSAFHMPRAKRLFEKEGFGVQTYPVDFKVGEKKITANDFLPSSSALEMTSKGIREFFGRVVYFIIK